VLALPSMGCLLFLRLPDDRPSPGGPG